MDKVKFVLLLIFLASKKGETSASPENKLDSNVDLDLNIFGQRIILKNKNLKADDNIRIRQNDSFGILNEPSREKGLQSVQKHKDPFRHMMEMFHNALKFVKIDNILTHEEDVYEKYERPRRLEKTRTIQQEINPVFNRIGLRDENEKVDVKTPPTPTTRPQAGQKRILTGTRRRKPSKIHRKPLVAIQMSTPPIRTLPPQHHRFIQHSTTVSPVTTPLAVKILPSFKPQNLPSRQRIRVKIPKNTSLPIIRQSVPDNVSPTNKPQIPSNPFIKTTNYIRQQTTPILFTKSQKTSPSRFIYPSSTSRPFIGIQSIDTNPIFTNSVKTLPLSSESFLSSKLPRPLSNLRSQSQAPSKGQIISSKPFNQFKKFKKTSSKIKLPHKSAIKSLPSKTRNVVHHFPRHPLPSPPPPLLPTSPRINGDTPSKPFKPSPKIIEGNFVPSTQAWTTKTGATNNKVTSGRRPPVVPRVPIIPKTQIPKFISTNGISNSGEKYRKGKGLNDDQRVTNNKDLLELYSTPSNFQCTNQEYPGLYADLETNCQTFHMCQVGGRQNTFICPVGTLFDQRYLVCNWSNQVNCRNSVEFYNINRKIYKPTS